MSDHDPHPAEFSVRDRLLMVGVLAMSVGLWCLVILGWMHLFGR